VLERNERFERRIVVREERFQPFELGEAVHRQRASEHQHQDAQELLEPTQEQAGGCENGVDAVTVACCS
jgi:hypothetical protein